MDRFLKPGMKLQLKGIEGTYVIRNLIGRGASCVVYQTDFYNETGVKSEHLLKEFNPKNLSVIRTETYELQVNPNEEIAFDEEKKRFREGFEKQIFLREKNGLKNYTANIQNVYEAYNTVYIDMNVTEGKSYDTVCEKSIYDLARRMKVLAEVVGKYHQNGYLHLDLKPSNIYVRPENETCEDVLLFDFDSVIEKDNVQMCNAISCTQEWAALEITSTSRRYLICEATDIFAVGEILFEKLMGRHSESWERRTFSQYIYDMDSAIWQNVNLKVQGLLNELFRHTLCNNVASRYQSIEKLILILDEIIKISNPEKPFLKSSYPEPLDFFVGREQELLDIHESLCKSNVLFLSGMGGIGKSELAKNYAKQYKNEYDTIIFAPYVSDLYMVVANDDVFPIYNMYRYQEEKVEDYAKRKLRKIKELCDNRTLIIIDNFDCMEDDLLAEIMKLDARVLITTRVDFSEFNCKQIKVEEIKDRESIFDIFRQYYTKSMTDEEFGYVEQIVDIICGHTMTVELLAKQMMVGRVKPEKMLERLKDVGIIGSGNEWVNLSKDDKFEKKNVYEHIQALFNLSELEDKEIYILSNLSILPYIGISTELFYSWCELESYDVINALIFEGWIKYDKLKDVISLHPIVAEIVLRKNYNNEKLWKKMLKNARETLIEDFETKKQYHVSILLSFIAKKLYEKNFDYRCVDIFIRKVCVNSGDFFKTFELITLLKYVVVIREEKLGVNNEETLIARCSLADVFLENGDSLAAKKEYNKILDIIKQQYYFEIIALKKSEIYRMSLRRIAGIYCMEKRYTESEKILRRLIGYTKKNYNNDTTRALLIQYADVLEKKGHYNSSVELLEGLLAATEIDIKNERVRNHELMVISTVLSKTYIKMNEYENALLYATKAYEIYLSMYGVCNKECLFVFESFARANIYLGNFPIAEEVINKAALVIQELFGPDHFKNYQIYLLYSELYESKKEYQQAWHFANLAKLKWTNNSGNSNYVIIRERIESQIGKLSEKLYNKND